MSARHIHPDSMLAGAGRELGRHATALGWQAFAVTEMPWSDDAGTVDETLRLHVVDSDGDSVTVFAFFWDVDPHGTPTRVSWRATWMDRNDRQIGGHSPISDDLQALRNLIRDHGQINLRTVA